MSKEKKKFTFLHAAYFPEKLKELSDPGLIFLGRSNAGKSSLMNALTNSALAHVSKTPGKTRSVNYYQDASALIWVDLPGYGYAKRAWTEREAWKKLMYAFFEALPFGSLAYLLMDAKRDLEIEEKQLLDALISREAQLKILLTKSDRLNQSLRKQRESYMARYLEKEFPNFKIHWSFVSAKKFEGIEALRKEIYRYGKKKNI